MSLPVTTISLALAMAMTLGTGIPDARAEGLFNRLFGGGIRAQRNDTPVRRDATPRNNFPAAPKKPTRKESAQAKERANSTQQARPRQPAAAVVTIDSPSYYNYRPDPLVAVDFAPLIKLVSQSASATGLAGETASALPAPMGLRAALPGLEGFALNAEKDIGKALVVHYSAHPDFMWITDNAVNSRAGDVLRVLDGAASEGLDPAEYRIAVPSAGAATNEFVRFEMALSARVLRYINDAQNGRINPNKLSGYHDFAAKPLDMQSALSRLASGEGVETYLASFHPQGSEYRILRDELASLKASEDNQIVVDRDLLLRPGETSTELPKLLHLIAADMDDAFGGAHGEVLARLATSEDYVDEIVPVIKAAQKRAGLKGDGVIGPRTVAALAGTSKADRLDKVKVALEQLRWLPQTLGETRVFINQPAYTAAYVEDGVEKLSMRVVIGRPSNQTSFFYDEIETVDYNPYWGVPQSILVNEMLPRLRRDPGYLDRSGYEVTDSRGKKIPSSAINWSSYGSSIPYNVRQQPSEANALGELKILFPNKHAIYMHDTPSRSLFQRDMRAFSHGCVRLQQPREMAAAVLGTTVDHVAAKLKKGHSSERVGRNIPVYVAYFTAWPDASGTVQYFADVYDRDAHLLEAIQKVDAVREMPDDAFEAMPVADSSATVQRVRLDNAGTSSVAPQADVIIPPMEKLPDLNMPTGEQPLRNPL
ncbi:L,D-transpeptidase family protein [Mesorhizobium sp. NBSH29]|uniref:L,D-transpeptidase family protein n=1 Tax=Mesorhizobium sp. NBSH29 TaxID=2654249 RepID=UPI001896464C|nr:L,D-transpeptidase family protein [Mesorhizobium sp. NBSH29]QPC87983.1 L,D-transpeptidase family protein [Mesorhizobium sp. NBSH29]